VLIINKAVKSKNTKNEETAFKSFLKRNKSLKYLLPILVIWLVVLFIFVLSGGFDSDDISAYNPTSTPSASPQENSDQNEPSVEVLPKKIRTDTNIKDNISNDPFDSMMNLTGIVYADINSTAIIEWGDSSYIVQINDAIGDSKWVVKDIELDTVTLQSGEDSIIVLNISDGAESN
jgi:type II secretory pathway component PulC